MTSQVPGARTVPAGEGQPVVPAAWHGFTDAWALGFREVYTVWLPRGRSEVSNVAIGRWQTWVRWLGSAYGPPTSTMMVLALSRTRSFTADHTWLLLLLGTINGGMFAAAVLCWKYALLKAHTLDELLEPCSNRDDLVGVITTALRHRYQASVPIVFALVPWLGLAAGDSRWLSSETGLFLLVNSSWSLMLLGNVSYWLAVPPILVIRLRNSRELRLRWNDPARTAGIRAMSEGYAFPAVFLALGAFAVTLPGAFDYPLFGRFLPYLYLWLVTLSLWVGVTTQLSIYTIVRRYRLRIMDELAAGSGLLMSEEQSAGLPAIIKREPELGTLLSVYGSVAGAPGLPYGTALVVQYVAAVVGSVVGFLLQ
ncbi:MAG TPA: hypothetical protein VGX23_37925 [Actinocrinis sp.]|nr:hypothetical protein [Actinocrinis sp.]